MAAKTVPVIPGAPVDEKREDAHVEDLYMDPTTKEGLELSHADLVEQALADNEEESKLGLRELFRLHYPAAIFSAMLSVALIMEGFDTGLINNFWGLQSYIQYFGRTDIATGRKYIPADWQAGINNAAQAGQIIGLLINGWAQPRFGARKVYITGMAILTCTTFVLFFAQSLEMLLAANIANGIPWGLFQILTTAYTAEMVPPAMRGTLTTWVSMCWGLGGFLGAVVSRAALELEGNAQWKLCYGLQWIWPVPLMIAAIFVPESRSDDAAKVLTRLGRPGYWTEERIRRRIALMEHTNEMEKQNAHQGSYADCFRGTNLRRTEIGIMTWLRMRHLCMAETAAFNFNMGIYGAGVVATGIAMWAITRVGRRFFYLSGVAGIGTTMLVMGIVSVSPVGESGKAVNIGVCLTFVKTFFKLTLGPACYTICAEMPSSRVRAQTMVMGRAAYVSGSIAMNQLVPRMINEKEWNMGGKAGFVFFGTCSLLFVYNYFRLPETRNRTFAEIDFLFTKRVSARGFKRYAIDNRELAERTNHEAKE